MNITSKIGKRQDIHIEQSYPYIGSMYVPDEDAEGTIVVFFSSDSTGIVLVDETRSYKIGEFITNWDESFFGPFYGTITITSKGIIG